MRSPTENEDVGTLIPGIAIMPPFKPEPSDFPVPDLVYFIM